MELTCTNDTICINEVLYDGVLEQSVELDYLLPDYCKGIFKVLCCRLIPHITQKRMANGRLMIEGICHIHVMYTAEETYRICTVTQKQPFHKTLELNKEAASPHITAAVRCDYVNCRATSQRRLDIRGALTIRTIVTAPKDYPVLCCAKGCGVQTDPLPLTVLGRRLSASQEFCVREELSVPQGKPSIDEILTIDTYASLTESRIIENRIITKGELFVHLLYMPCGEQPTPEVIESRFPFSQVLDLPGVTEEHSAAVRFDVTDYTCSCKQDESGQCCAVNAEFSICAVCEADKNMEIHVLRDAFSTQYQADTQVSPLTTKRMLYPLKETHSCKTTIEIPQNELNGVYDLACRFTEEDCRMGESSFIITGTLSCTLLACDSESMPVLYEKKTPCELTLQTACSEESCFLQPIICPSSVSYRMISDTEVEVCAELCVTGTVYADVRCHAVTQIDLRENDAQKPQQPPLRLYYASAGERIWEIAKRYGASPLLIAQENEGITDPISAPCMLMIPSLSHSSQEGA